MSETGKEVSPDTLRRKRVQRLKKAILISIALAVLIPLIACILLFVYVHKLEKQVEQLQQIVAESETLSVSSEENGLKEGLSDGDAMEAEVTEANDAEVEGMEANDEDTWDGIRREYLTFDDGPSIYTDDILDILNEYDVKATFFVVGKEEEVYAPLYQRIVDEGHAIGMHSYSHKYSEIYASVDAFSDDVVKMKKFLKEKTGIECSLYRFPGGSSNTVCEDGMGPFIEYLNEQDITYFDWNITSKDASPVMQDAQTIADNCTGQLENYENAVILMHDSGDKSSTVEALPIIIERIQAMENTEIVPITDETVPVQHRISE